MRIDTVEASPVIPKLVRMNPDAVPSHRASGHRAGTPTWPVERLCTARAGVERVEAVVPLGSRVA
ncbi:hypothetical protein [Humibacter albus]|uniref:hypothetical protein n=1 Tax=Humibacter albus TaxID=427754 RepID=UPI0003B6326D|nr:hypothetical protein [Humibacter albus]